jgi:hypothetical protein
MKTPGGPFLAARLQKDLQFRRAARERNVVRRRDQ